MQTTIFSKISFVLITAVCLLTVLAYGAVHQPIIALFYLLVAAMVILWAADAYKTGVMRFSRSNLQIPLLLLGIYGLVQVIPFGSVLTSESALAFPRTISIDPFATQVTAIHIFALSAFFAAALVQLDGQARLRRFVSLMTIFGAVYAFYAILQSVLSPGKIYGIYEPASATHFGSFVNRHNFAAIIEMAISLPLALVFTGAVDKDKKLLYWVAIAIMATAMLLSGSRGGLVAMLGGMVFLALLTFRAKGRRSVGLSITFASMLLAIAIAGAIFVGGDTSLTRFADAAAASDLSSSRTHIWSTTLKVITAHLPFGTGLGAFAQAYTQFDTASGFHRVEQAHNDYLQVISDAGIVGVILGGLFLFWLYLEGSRNIRNEDLLRRGIAVGALTGCVAILIHSLFDFVLHITAVSVMFLTLLALLVASGRQMAEREVRVKVRKSASITHLDRSRG